MGLVNASYPTSVWTGVAGDRVDRFQDAAPTPKDYDTIVSEIVALETELFNRDVFAKTNGNVGTLSAGMLAYLKSDGTVDKANAAAVATSNVLGIVTADAATGATVTLKRNGLQTLTTTQWDNVAGTTGGLTVGAAYYLSDATAGKMTATAPTTATHTSNRVGIALSSTTMLLTCGDQPRLL